MPCWGQWCSSPLHCRCLTVPGGVVRQQAHAGAQRSEASPEAGVGSLCQLVRGMESAAAANSCGGLGAQPVRCDASRK